MSEQTLKELLNPPFKKIFGGIIDASGKSLLTSNCRVFFDHEDYPKLHDNFVGFITAAMNEKWERDFGEPMRWIKKKSLGIDWIDCPKCKHGLQEGTKDLNYCPFCGQRLLLPKE